MAASVQQTNASALAGTIAACSPGALGNVSRSHDCSIGGTPGASALSVSSDASGINRRLTHYEWDVPAGYTWGAGTWTLRINVTIANTNITWTNLYVCQINSANVNVATIGSITGQTLSLGTTGVKSISVSGSAITPSAGDKVYIVPGFANASMSAASFSYIPDQIIDSPFTAGGGGPVDEDYEYVGGGYYPLAA